LPSLCYGRCSPRPQAEHTDSIGAYAKSSSAEAEISRRAGILRSTGQSRGAGVGPIRMRVFITAPGTHWYGATKSGNYMKQSDAQQKGYRPAYQRVASGPLHRSRACASGTSKYSMPSGLTEPAPRAGFRGLLTTPAVRSRIHRRRIKSENRHPARFARPRSYAVCRHPSRPH